MGFFKLLKGKSSSIHKTSILAENGSVTDADGNIYQTVKIGNQVWMEENLRTTKYNDDTTIPMVVDSLKWTALSSPGYCYYNNTTDAIGIKKYGALYNWYTVNSGKLAPAGWHVPSDSEWDTFQNYLIANGYNWDRTTTGNKIAKSLAAQTDWATHKTKGTIGNDLNKNNRSGFSAFPCGMCGSGGQFNGIGFGGGWWSATEHDASVAIYLDLSCDHEHLLKGGSPKKCGFSVRLVRD
jgi:uncharacterized protein (TIGR02145 family)